jgi:M6 family metalloprotease-like protein
MMKTVFSMIRGGKRGYKQIASQKALAINLSLLFLIFVVITPSHPSLNAKEEPVSLSGVINLIWGDSIDGSETTLDFYLTDDKGETTKLLIDQSLLHSAGDLSSLNRQSVMVGGAWMKKAIDQEGTPILSVDNFSTQPENHLSNEFNAAGLMIGTKSWASILCKFADEPDEPRPLSFFKEMYANTYPGLDHYWRELSYNNINLAGSDAFGWYTLPQPESFYFYDMDGDGGVDIDLPRLAQDCASAGDADIYFPDYYGINLMFNTPAWCSFYGSSAWQLDKDGVSQNYGITWIWSHVYGASLHVIEHEMGHGFGLPHSYTFARNDNYWDVMGVCCLWFTVEDPIYGTLGIHTIAHQKDVLGWMPASQVYVANSDSQATIRLDALALATTSNYRMLKIPIGESASHFYTLEARKSIGYDEGIPGQAVIIHEVDTTETDSARLLDLDADLLTFDDQMWTPGETFVSITNGISVTVESETATGFVVTVDVGPPPPKFSACDSQPAIPEAECDALVSLYKNTHGDDWFVRQGWLDYLDPCDWYGV